MMQLYWVALKSIWAKELMRVSEFHTINIRLDG